MQNANLKAIYCKILLRCELLILPRPNQGRRVPLLEGSCTHLEGEQTFLQMVVLVFDQLPLRLSTCQLVANVTRFVGVI